MIEHNGVYKYTMILGELNVSQYNANITPFVRSPFNPNGLFGFGTALSMYLKENISVFKDGKIDISISGGYLVVTEDGNDLQIAQPDESKASLGDLFCKKKWSDMSCFVVLEYVIKQIAPKDDGFEHPVQIYDLEASMREHIFSFIITGRYCGGKISPANSGNSLLDPTKFVDIQNCSIGKADFSNHGRALDGFVLCVDNTDLEEINGLSSIYDFMRWHSDDPSHTVYVAGYQIINSVNLNRVDGKQQREHFDTKNKGAFFATPIVGAARIQKLRFVRDEKTSIVYKLVKEKHNNIVSSDNKQLTYDVFYYRLAQSI